MNSSGVLKPTEPKSGVDLQGFTQHPGPRVLQTIAAQIHFPETRVATECVHKHCAPGSQSGVS